MNRRRLSLLFLIVPLILTVRARAVAGGAWQRWQGFRDAVAAAGGCEIGFQLSGIEVPSATVEIRFALPGLLSVDARTDAARLCLLFRDGEPRILLAGDRHELRLPGPVEERTRFGRLPRTLLEWDARVAGRLRAAFVEEKDEGFDLIFRHAGREEWRFAADGTLRELRLRDVQEREWLVVTGVHVLYGCPAGEHFRRHGRRVTPLFSAK